jgi:hypothetical protein
MALGAQREEVLGLMLGDGLRTALYGLALGLAASVGAERLIQSTLYGTRPLDPAIFVSVGCVVANCGGPSLLRSGMEGVADRSDAGIAK